MRPCKTCSKCQRQFPEDLISDLIVGDSSFPSCPICALKVRNAFAGLPADTPFSGPAARSMHDRAMEYLETHPAANDGKS